MKILKFLSIIGFFLLLMLVPTLYSSEIDITSDKMQVFESEGVVVFTGKVFGVKGDLKVWCDQMYVYYTTNQQGKREVSKVIALGKVIIEKGKWKAYAGKAVYFRNQEKLVLEETPKVWHDKNLVEGDIIVIYFNEDKSEVLAKDQGRVRARVYFE
ncbi:OstA family protein [Thermodesulfobacterium geofontis OPF15]|jgi:lipopolysaccharide export system protein LptA|uniref:OstA family protein n=1 Tax=Thermodesulfobacterium geofontis (strain OPF15) TaxID=795359 RepID=F8C2R8_THEGP|nr:lipopolysaccharide transport periplasmic protein LptA [Thermodesulfobacterium geofontis]AEH23473.1 OstA family protein [Thermodesulfobacterium geofontis OPF15]